MKNSFQLVPFLHTDAEEFLQRQHSTLLFFPLSDTFLHEHTHADTVSHQPVKCGLMRHNPGALSATPTLPVLSEGGEAWEWAWACETPSTSTSKVEVWRSAVN